MYNLSKLNYQLSSLFDFIFFSIHQKISTFSFIKHLYNFSHIYAVTCLIIISILIILKRSFFFGEEKEKEFNTDSGFKFLPTICIPLKMIEHLKVFKHPYYRIIFLFFMKLLLQCTKTILSETMENLFTKDGKWSLCRQTIFYLLFIGFLKYVIDDMEDFSINKSVKCIKDHITLYVLNKKTSFFIENERGVILDRLDDCYDKMRELLDFFSEVFQAVIEISTFIFFINKFFKNTFMDKPQHKITFLCFFTSYTICVTLLCYPKAKKIAYYSNLSSKSATKTQQKINDLINNVTHVKNMGLEKEEHNYIKSFTGREFNFYKNFSKENVLLQSITNMFAIFPIIFVIIWSFNKSFISSSLKGTELTTYSSIFQLYSVTVSLNDIVEKTSYQFEDVNKFYDSLCLFTDNNVNDIFSNSINEKYTIPASTEKSKSSKFNIKFVDILFKDKKNHPILNNINLKIKEGDHVAIIGSSGSGKSTLLNALMKNLDFNSGSIYIGEKNIHDYKHHIFFNTLSFIPQDNNLFNRTVKENIVLGRNVSEECLTRACKLAGCYDLIQTLPDKFDFVVGNSGERLSGGQKQRVVIARNLIKEDPNILILDEATSALDLKTEKDVLENILNFYTRQTIIKVSHRLNFLERYKSFKIFVMKNGLLVQQGKLDDLIEDKEGAFYQLWKNSKTE